MENLGLQRLIDHDISHMKTLTKAPPPSLPLLLSPPQCHPQLVPSPSSSPSPLPLTTALLLLRLQAPCNMTTKPLFLWLPSPCMQVCPSPSPCRQCQAHCWGQPGSPVTHRAGLNMCQAVSSLEFTTFRMPPFWQGLEDI